MKRINCLLLSGVLCLSLTACGPGVQQADPSDGPGLTAPAQTLELLAPMPAEAVERWGTLVGYWNGEDGEFLLFDWEDSNTAAFLQGLWDTGGGRGYGVVTAMELTAKEELRVRIHYPAQEATDDREALPEQHTTILVNDRDLEEGTICVSIDGGESRTYRYAGAREADAYRDHQLHRVSTGTWEEKADVLWSILEGCWGADEDRFVCLSRDDAGCPVFLSGFWHTPMPYNREPALVTSLVDLGGGVYTLGVAYPANEENAADSQDLQVLRYTVSIGIGDLSRGTITVEAPDDEVRSYTYVAESYARALELGQ